MNRTILSLVIGAAALTTFASTAFAAEKSALSLTSFRASALAGFQGSTSSNTFTGQLGWTPSYALGSDFGLRAIAGASLFKSGLDSRFVVLDGQALATYALSSIELEVGGGVQSWLGQGVTSPVLSGNLAWMPAAPWFGVVDRLVGGYSYLLSSTAKTSEFKLGAGIAF